MKANISWIIIVIIIIIISPTCLLYQLDKVDDSANLPY